MKILKRLCCSMCLIILFTGCYQDMDDVVTPASELEIKRFIWKAMNSMYLYKENVPDLADDRFENQQEFHKFLKNFQSPEALFAALKADKDEFSIMTDDYRKLERLFDGISLSNGMSYGLVRYSRSSTNVLGYVKYVMPMTSAEAKGVRRGMLFNSINGVQLTLKNYADLLEADSYSIGLAKIKDGEISSTGETITLQKTEYTANPVHLSKVLQTSQGKVGYLLYNSFTSTFDPVLNETFGMFRAQGIKELIVDLRYNSGGSVETASDLASMITGQFRDEIFFTKQWNKENQAWFKANEPHSLVERFDNTINNGASINSLKLSKVFFVTSSETASASELLINGLKPYIEVVQIGERTTGKFQASTTLYDSENFRRKGANLNHSYAIQPLIYKTLNAAGVTDYVDGLDPDISVSKNIANLGTLGAPEEVLLAAALRAIHGNLQDPEASAVKYTGIDQSGMKNALYQKMYSEVPAVLDFRFNF